MQATLHTAWPTHHDGLLMDAWYLIGAAPVIHAPSLFLSSAEAFFSSFGATIARYRLGFGLPCEPVYTVKPTTWPPAQTQTERRTP